MNDDLISRQAAINTVLNIRQKCDTNDLDEYRDILVECFEELPTLDPVRRGRWELEEEQKHVELIYSCSECGCIAWGNEEISNYCPNCGARMEESDEQVDTNC